MPTCSRRPDCVGSYTQAPKAPPVSLEAIRPRHALWVIVHGVVVALAVLVPSVKQLPQVTTDGLDVHEVAVTSAVARVLLILPTSGFAEVCHRRKLADDRPSSVVSPLESLSCATTRTQGVWPASWFEFSAEATQSQCAVHSPMWRVVLIPGRCAEASWFRGGEPSAHKPTLV